MLVQYILIKSTQFFTYYIYWLSFHFVNPTLNIVIIVLYMLIGYHVQYFGEYLSTVHSSPFMWQGQQSMCVVCEPFFTVPGTSTLCTCTTTWEITEKIRSGIQALSSSKVFSTGGVHAPVSLTSLYCIWNNLRNMRQSSSVIVTTTTKRTIYIRIIRIEFKKTSKNPYECVEYKKIKLR